MTGIAAAFTELLQPTLALDVAVDRHFAGSYRQRTNGVWDDRVGFVAHIAHLRDIISHVSVDVLEELEVGDLYAERHIVSLTKRDGEVVEQEVYVFARIDLDGRFTLIEETTLMRRGAEADRGIGNAKASQ